MFGFLHVIRPVPAPLNRLAEALRENARSGKTIRINPRDTSFESLDERDERMAEDAATIDAVRSLPTHY